jgi:hypothetical protein
MARQVRHGVERTDQHGKRHQLIGSPRHAQHDVAECMLELVTALSEILDFAEQVEKSEQGEEREQDEQDRGHRFTRDVTLVDLHREKRRKEDTAIRR